VPETPPLAALGWSYSGLQTVMFTVKDFLCCVGVALAKIAWYFGT